MAAEFKILGEVEVQVDGRRLELGHARQCHVLGCLLVDVNRPVTADQLIDRIWAADPPHRARNALAAYISRIRQVLSTTDAAAIVRGSGGYTLQAEAGSVDLHRFRHLTHDARTCADPDTAMAQLDEALGLWRGTPFATLDTPWANGVREAVEAERRAVLLDRNDAALAAGRHALVLGDVAAAWERRPLDERLAGQLMLAQYRGGRQADALATYRTMRERLVDELGVDPGPALQAVHQQLLDGDPLGPPAAARPVPPAPRPIAPGLLADMGAGIPRRTTQLIGRIDDVARVSAALIEGPLVTLVGVGGVGKTRLALEVADGSQHAYADGAWNCELAPLSDGAAVGQAIAATLRLPPRSGAFDDAVVEALRTREALLVVDNCEHLLADVSRLVDRIIRTCPGVRVLATSRETLGVEGERIVPVQPLNERDAAELFAARARASRPDFDPSREPVGAIAEICRRLDGVPLAIELAAARMRAMSSLDVARRLDRLRLLTGGARGAHPRQQSVAATIDWSYRLLPAEEQALFARLSVFAGGFELEAAHLVCGADTDGEDDVLDLLSNLVDKSMVTVRADFGTVGATRYGVLETLRAYGRDRLRDADTSDELQRRHARYYTELVERAAAGVRGPDERAWVTRMTPNAGTTYAAPDFDNIRVAFDWALGARDLDMAFRLVTSLLEPIHLRAGFHDFGWLERAIDVADPDHPLYVAAVGVAARGMWTGCEFERARAMVRRVEGREPGPGITHLADPSGVLADIALWDGAPADALAHYSSLADRLRTDADGSADTFRRLMALERITLCHQALGSPELGLDAGREALSVADATANPSMRALARCALGRALADADPQQAMTWLAEAAELAASVENNWLTGNARTDSAAIVAVHGDPRAAASEVAAMLDHWERGGPGVIPMQRDTLRHAAKLLLRLGDTEAAHALHHTFVAAGWPRPPLDGTPVPGRSGPPLSGVAAVELARAALRRHCEATAAS